MQTDELTPKKTEVVNGRYLMDREIIIVNTIWRYKEMVRLIKIHCFRYGSVLGFDTEGEQAVLIQIATTKNCFLVQHLRLPENQEFLDILKDPTILKVGVDPYGDAIKLNEFHGIVVCGTLDLRAMAKELNYSPTGLAKLAETHLKVKAYKDMQIILSNWYAKHLSAGQVRYAALDAIVVLLLFQKFHTELQNKKGAGFTNDYSYVYWPFLDRQMTSVGEFRYLIRDFVDYPQASIWNADLVN